MDKDKLITDTEAANKLPMCTCRDDAQHIDPDEHMRHCVYRRWYMRVWNERLSQQGKQ